MHAYADVADLPEGHHGRHGLRAQLALLFDRVARLRVRHVDDEILDELRDIETNITRLHSLLPAATRIVLALPEVYPLGPTDGATMSNFPVKSDTAVKLRILTVDDTGKPEPAPAGDIFTVTSSNPTSLQADIGTMLDGGPAVVLTPLVLASPGIVIEVHDSAGLKMFDQVVDVVTDVVPATAIGLDVALPEVTPQPAPSAPGP